MNLIGAEFVLDDWWADVAAIVGRVDEDDDDAVAAAADDDDDDAADDVVFDRSRLLVRDELTDPAELVDVDAFELVGLTVLNCS